MFPHSVKPKWWLKPSSVPCFPPVLNFCHHIFQENEKIHIDQARPQPWYITVKRSKRLSGKFKKLPDELILTIYSYLTRYKNYHQYLHDNASSLIRCNCVKLEKVNTPIEVLSDSIICILSEYIECKSTKNTYIEHESTMYWVWVENTETSLANGVRWLNLKLTNKIFLIG